MQVKFNHFIYLLVLMIFARTEVFAEQFNTSSYEIHKKGVLQMKMGVGQREIFISNSFALAKRIQFQLNLDGFWNRPNANQPMHFTTSVNLKYQYWILDNDRGGSSLYLGIGRAPGYYYETQYLQTTRNYWLNIPTSLNFFSNKKLVWDIMPGTAMKIGKGNALEFTFTYSTCLTWNDVIPTISLLGEIYGTESEYESRRHYRAGVQWQINDPISTTVSYGNLFNGRYGSGFEIGVIVTSPSIAKSNKL